MIEISCAFKTHCLGDSIDERIAASIGTKITKEGISWDFYWVVRDNNNGKVR